MMAQPSQYYIAVTDVTAWKEGRPHALDCCRGRLADHSRISLLPVSDQQEDWKQHCLL